MNFLSRVAIDAVNKELNKPQKGDGKTVHLPKLLLIIGVVCTCIFLIPTVIMFIKNEIVAGLVFLAFSLVCSTLIIGYCNQRIYYDEEGFTSKTFLGIKRRFSYADIEYIQGDLVSDSKLKVNNKNVYLDQIAIGKTEFVAFAQKQYKLLNGGKKIPQSQKKSKFDAVFKGNVKNPTAVIVVDVIIAVLFASLLVIFPITNNPTPMDKLEFKTVTVNNYTAGDEYLDLSIVGFETEPYLRGYKETLSDTAKFLTLLDSKEEIKIGYETIVDDGVTEYRVEYVEDKNGLVYTTPEDFHEFYQKDFTAIMIVIASFLAVWIAFALLSIYVGRNPRKFSKKFVYLFFKKDHIKI